MTTYTNHNGNGSRPRLSDSYAAEARAYIHRYELECSKGELLAFIDGVMTRCPVEEHRCHLIRVHLLEVYWAAEADGDLREVGA